MPERTSTAISVVALLLGFSIATRVLPPAWRTPLRVIGGVIFVGLIVYETRRRPLTLREPSQRSDGTCDCGYDLHRAPPLETSRHFFDVWKRMGSTRKIVICPECGKKHTLWEHD